MMLIADCGGTKCDWILVSGGEVREVRRLPGVNMATAADGSFAAMLRGLDFGGDVREIHFYGAGCLGAAAETAETLLRERFPEALTAEAASDMLGAARALCGREAGIACILGTGSNSCLYDGSEITDNVPPLGYVLGDEGSGAVLGRNLINLIFKRRASAELIAAFSDRFGLSAADVIGRVYRSERPQGFLAGFAPFIYENLGFPEVREMVVGSMAEFFRRNVCAYRLHDSLPANFIGSVAANFASELAEAARLTGCSVGRIEASPVKGLVAYHSQQSQS